MIVPKHIHLHGPGRAGTALLALWRRAGVRNLSLSGGRPESVEAARSILGATTPWSESAPPLDGGTLLVLGVPDDALVAAAQNFDLSRLNTETAVIHLSGLHGRADLRFFETKTERTAAFHPLRSFPTRDPGRGDLEGAIVAITARAVDTSFFDGLAVLLGGEPVHLTEESRALYHGAAALAANGTLALLASAVTAMTKAGVSESIARSGLARLVGAVVGNAQRLGVSAALTGPVVRGDITTLEAHLRAFNLAAPEQIDLYLDVVRALISVAEARPDASGAARVREWLAKKDQS